MFKLGEVHVPSDKDFEEAKEFCQNEQGYKLDYNKRNIKIWVKTSEISSIHVIKARIDFDNISADLMFSVLMDTEYKHVWDEYLIQSKLYLIFVSKIY